MSFPSSPINGQTAVLNGLTYAYNSADGAWVRVAISAVVYSAATVLNDLSGQCDGVKSVFALKVDQTAVSGIVDNKDLEVLVNGVKMTPYVTEQRYPWITPYDSYRGFRAVTTGTTDNWLVIYNSPELGSQVTVTQLNSSSSKQSRRYPYSATSIALGD